MENAIEQPPREDTVSEATCAHCGRQMFVEKVAVGRAVPIPHRRVTGAFVQFIGADGMPVGPWWAVCQSCERDPLDLPEVKAAYRRIIQQE